MSKGINFNKRYVTMARSLGMAIIIANQQLIDLMDYVINNFCTFVVKKMRNPADVNTAGQAMGMNEEMKARVRMLKDNEAIVNSERDMQPEVVIIDNLPAMRKPSDKEVEQAIKPFIEKLMQKVRARVPLTEIRKNNMATPSGQNINADMPQDQSENDKDKEAHNTLEDWLSFLKFVDKNRGLGVREIYEQQGCSGRKGNRLKNDMVATGLLREIKTQNQKGNQKIELELTESGMKYIGRQLETNEEILPGKGSDEHKKLQDYYKNQYKSGNNIVLVEEDVRGKKIDVLVQDIMTKKTIGLEIHLNRKFGLLLEQIRKNFAVGINEQHIYVPERNYNEAKIYLLGNSIELSGEKVRLYSIPRIVPNLVNKEQ